MSENYESIIRTASTALEPLTTDLEPRLPKLTGIRAVLFDIYGTLLISASGDIGAAEPAVRGDAFAAALRAIGQEFSGDPAQGVARWGEVIASHHDQSRSTGLEYPEVDIVAVWRETCRLLHEQGELAELPSAADMERLAIEFEVRVNPAWPMPGMLPCLDELRRMGTVMGIISNAQFFTPLVFPAILERSVDQLGFHAELRYYSYEHGCAKPGRELYDMAAEGLAGLNIGPPEVLYVGNDMRNDIWPAVGVGFRTALFAGDRRSLRLRSDDVNPDQYGTPDAVVTNLLQIPAMLEATVETK